MTSLELTCEVLKPACARRRTAFDVCFGHPSPGSEAMFVGRRLRHLIRTNSTAAGRAPLEVDKNRGKCPNFVYASATQYTKKRPAPRRSASY